MKEILTTQMLEKYSLKEADGYEDIRFRKFDIKKCDSLQIPAARW